MYGNTTVVSSFKLHTKSPQRCVFLPPAPAVRDRGHAAPAAAARAVARAVRVLARAHAAEDAPALAQLAAPRRTRAVRTLGHAARGRQC